MIMDLIRRHRFESLARIILISSLFMIDDGASSERLPSAVSVCSPNPCQNQALCRSRGDGYSCFCVPGFQGARCQIDVNECLSQPCRNGATCVDGVGRYTCACAPGFTGHTCGLEIDECQSQPCLNGGSCHDNTNGFTCTCQPGFQGDRCENDIDECQAQPCQNGALCIDGVNQYSCDCSYTAFIGQHCETLAPPCLSQPCLNSAPCKDNEGNYTCECWPGFEGRRCEVDINECGSSPCMHGGRCMERSWRALYGTEPLLPAVYDHQHAAGFICSCPPETTGSFCQEVIDHCDSRPCQNGGMCESRAGGYVCHCLQQSQDGVLHSGVNCDLELVGCEGHECQNEGSCSPFLTDGTHGYTCSCSPGFTGPLCETSTAFSFARSGHLLLQAPMVESDASCNITLSFRTVLTRTLLFRRTSRGQLLGLELEAGRLRLTLRREASAGAETTETPPGQVLELPHNVTDGEWHSVEAVLGKWLLSLRLKDDSGACENQDCQRVAPINTALAALAGLASPLKSTFIGGAGHTDAHADDIGLPAFIGCMQDVFVDSQLVVPAEWLSDSAVNVSPGCSHRDRCLDVPCQNRGQCINLWQNYQCRCPRPYEGQDCADEYVTGRFWSENSPSYAVFNVTDDQGQDLTVSLFVRTRRQTGLLLALANGDRHYLGIWLEDGRVRVQLNNVEGVKGERVVSDGDSHFVSVELTRDGVVTLYVAAQKQGHVRALAPVDVRAGDVAYVGGLPGEQTETSTAAFGGHFKGCIQDLRINDRRLQFFGLRGASSVSSFPLEHMANVTAGCSGDNVCKRNPCLNGGMCYSMWDDFSCTCPSSTSGRRCEEVRWCELSPCPADAECRMLSQGYECYSNATFLDGGSVLTYRGNGRIARNLTSLSLSVRTRKCHAAILHAERGSAFVTVSIRDGLLFMELQSAASGGEEENTSGDDGGGGGGGGGGGERPSAVILGSRRSVCDGEWHSAHFFMAAPWARASRWTLVLDEEDVEEASTSAGRAGNLDFLGRGDVDVFLGGLGPDADAGGGWALAGCLGTVEIGGVALPYHGALEVNFPRAQREQFVRASPAPPRAGCGGAAVCWPRSPCLNGGECRDLFDAYDCSCAEGWAGRHCEFFTDTCASAPCGGRGNCSVRGTGYECACEVGYAGADCELEADVCERHECAHGGTCLHGPDKYACLCPENYTGPFCKERVEEIPWYLIVRTIRHKLPVSVCGDDTRNYTCFNGGNCTDRELSCDCPPGFMGHRCEQEVDECKSNPCLNGGYCRNLINKFVCVCDMSFAGEVCQTDVSDIYFYVAVLLWQNLFQLLSYLIIRLDDDEPEIDWGGDE